MNDQYEDSVEKIKTYDKSIQKAWNLLSMHNSELLLENYELKEQMHKLWSMSIFKFALWKLKVLFTKDY
jgi:hypothetical protein